MLPLRQTRQTLLVVCCTLFFSVNGLSFFGYQFPFSKEKADLQDDVNGQTRESVGVARRNYYNYYYAAGRYFLLLSQVNGLLSRVVSRKNKSELYKIGNMREL